MQLHNIPKTKAKNKKRVGRGGKRGFTSGRGTKGQRARAGHKVRPAERDLILSIPKKRGFSNSAKSSKPVVFNISDLERVFSSDEKGVIEVTPKVLKERGVLPSRYRGGVKLLGKGAITIPLKINGMEYSELAKEKIEKAGGSVAEDAAPKNG